jgi:hypothetical protein
MDVTATKEDHAVVKTARAFVVCERLDFIRRALKAPFSRSPEFELRSER